MFNPYYAFSSPVNPWGNRKTKAPRYSRKTLPPAKRPLNFKVTGRYSNRVSEELKAIDTAVSNIDLLATPNVSLLNNIQQGTTNNTMLGRRAILKSIQCNYSIRTDPVASATATQHDPDQIRVLIVYDKSPQGSTPQLVDILDANDINSFRNLNNTDRFIILHDQTHDMGFFNISASTPPAGVVTGPLMIANKVNKKVNLLYEGPSTAGIVGISHGAVFFYCFNLAPLSTDSNNVISFRSRIRYADA